MSSLTIGEVARRAGVGVETVRFYERKGLLEDPRKHEAGYRLYEESAVARLLFIKRAKQLGFTLNEIKTLLTLRLDPDADRGDIKRQLGNKIKCVEGKMRDLEQMRVVLHRLWLACDGEGPMEGCPILEALDHGWAGAETECPPEPG
jgi:Hg(II)-responsive transcriptional regulator